MQVIFQQIIDSMSTLFVNKEYYQDMYNNNLIDYIDIKYNKSKTILFFKFKVLKRMIKEI